MTIDQRQLKDDSTVRVLALQGDLDVYSCHLLRDRLIQLSEEDGVALIVLNLEKVEYIDSAGLGTLVGGLKRLSKASKGLKLSDVHHNVDLVLKVTGLNRVFARFDSVSAATTAS